MKKVAMVYTGAGVVSMLSGMAKQMYPDIEIMNLLDDSLIGDCVKAGEMTKDVRRRLMNIFQYAYDAGAVCILLTCSSVGEAAYTGRELFSVPILRIDEPMAKEAVEKSQRIGVIATLPTTLDPTCDLVENWARRLNRKVEIVKGLAQGAYEAVISGDGERHDAIISETAAKLSHQCDTFLLAQASMARMEQKLSQITGKQVYSSPRSGIEQLRSYL